VGRRTASQQTGPPRRSASTKTVSATAGDLRLRWLTTGQNVSGRILLVALLLSSVARGASSVRVTMTPAPESTRSVAIRARALDASTVPIEQRIDVAPGFSRELLLPAEAGWVVEAEAEGYWSPRVLVGPGQTADLLLYRTTRVSGTTAVPAAEIGIRLEARPQDPPPPTIDLLPCAVEPLKTFRCDVPAGPWGFSVRSRGYAPVYEFAQPLSPGGTVDLGKITAVAGASFSGWVTAETRTWDPKRARVYIRPSSKPTPLSTAPSAAVSPVGFFQFTNVEPGRYQAVVTQLDYSRDVRNVEVVAGLEARLSAPMVLGPACALTLVIEPPVGPDGAPWNVEIRDSMDPASSSVVGEGVANAGQFRWRELRAGQRYWAGLKTSSGQRWMFDDVGFVMDAAVVERRIEVAVERVGGVVSLGKLPLSAQLTFGLRSNVQATFSSGQDGRFGGFLPRLGPWRVRVLSKDVSRDLDVQVARNSSGEANVEIRLDDSAIRGVLVTEKDELFEGHAFVVVYAGGDTNERHDVEGGHFRIGGLSPGSYRVFAEGSGAKSATIAASVREDEESDEVRLVMKPRRTIRLLVLGPGGPAPRVPIAVVPATSDEWAQAVPFLFTDAEGRFSYPNLGPEENERCFVFYGSNRYASKIARVPVSPEEVTITLDTIGGMIVTTGSDVDNPWLVHDGCPIWRKHFQRWGNKDFPLFSPGRYDLCPTVTWQVTSQCVGGVLEPMKTLQLNLRKTAPAGAR
jgi:hypothetical protein